MKRGRMVERVEPGSIAEELEIAPGDKIIAVNDIQPQDILDWHLAQSSEELVLTVLHTDGELVEYEIEKDYDEALGIVFESPVLDEIRRCQNRCVFCFVDQMPPAMRSTLYVKDDDYRLSFLSGSYITLTNLRETDLERIEKLHVSPLYVSVHTTNADLRRRMMNHKRAGDVLPVLERLAKAGISFHTQIVLCPELNDKEHLDQTIADLYGLFPAVKSLAVVPVGLTGHREGLYPLSPFDQSHAHTVLQKLATWQQRCLENQGTRFVFASDEFYNMAGADIPADTVYEDYPQLENGVGLLRLMYNDWERWQEKLPADIPTNKKVTVATGASAARYLQPIIDRLDEINGLSVRLEIVKNNFFGGHVTVAGLLTYQDLLASLQNSPPADVVFLPDVMFKEGKELFLDGHTISDLSCAVNTEIRAANSLDALLTDLLESK